MTNKNEGRLISRLLLVLHPFIILRIYQLIFVIALLLGSGYLLLEDMVHKLLCVALHGEGADLVNVIGSSDIV